MQRTVQNDEITLLREAISLLDASGEPVERARALAELGVAVRRAKRPIEAGEPLRLAVDLAHRSGATAVEEHALAALRATGARPRRRVVTGPGALTRSERRIAELAAAGRLNREIAETLVVTLGMVEYHLRNAYRKLDITSRAQLNEVLRPQRAATLTKLSVRVRGSSSTGLPSGSNSWLPPGGIDLAREGARTRSTRSEHSPYRRWESRSSAATATI
jgi:DNA-binding CsgD family transcriptional regulator